MARRRRRMKVLNETVEGDLDVTSDLKITGMVTGNVTVRESAWLDLYGTVGGSLLIAKEASAQVFGTVRKDLDAEGFASIDGTVGGTVRRHQGGQLFIG